MGLTIAQLLRERSIVALKLQKEDNTPLRFAVPLIPLFLDIYAALSRREHHLTGLNVCKVHNHRTKSLFLKDLARISP